MYVCYAPHICMQTIDVEGAHEEARDAADERPQEPLRSVLVCSEIWLCLAVPPAWTSTMSSRPM
jgi:hypothetical protein